MYKHKKEEIMTESRNLERKFESKLNEVMEQNPFQKNGIKVCYRSRRKTLAK